MLSASDWAASSTFESWLPRLGGDPPLELRQMLQLRFDDRFQLVDIRADLFKHGAHDAAVLLQERGQQMDRLDLRIPRLGGQLLRAGHGFLGFDRQFVESKWHSSVTSFQLSTF